MLWPYLTIVAAIVLCISQVGCSSKKLQYKNPLQIPIADPYVLRIHDNYYLYGTSRTEIANGFEVWTSKDLINWTNNGMCFQKTDSSWGRDQFWAPTVIHKANAFYLFYSALGHVGDHSSHRICVAMSTSPLGPFTDIAAPLLETGKAVIDPFVLVDATGSYLYYSADISESDASRIFCIRLSDDFTSTQGQSMLCTEPSQEWEGNRWNEAPCVFKTGDCYVMTYSAQGFYDPHYAVGYATAKTPLGPWIKNPQPLLQMKDGLSGPGHNCIIDSPDGKEWFIVYHVHEKPSGGGDRLLCIDRLSISEDGELATDGPNGSLQSYPLSR